MDKPESDFNDILSSFSKSPQDGISKAQNYLMKPNFNDFESFIEDVKKTQKSNCCIVSWSGSTVLSARCLDCQLKDNSCICIPCFLAGKHDQHHSYLLASVGDGNCDCGDPNFWKPSGNCPNHPGPDPNPDITQMTKENRDKFILVFKAAYNGAFLFSNSENFSTIINWIIGFISYGDGLRRCVSIAITSDSEKYFVDNLLKLKGKNLDSLMDLLGKLISDRHFSIKMGETCFHHYLELRYILREELKNGPFYKDKYQNHPIKTYLNFCFHFFNESPLNHMISNCNFNWVDFTIEGFKFVLDTCKELNMDYFKLQEIQTILQVWYLSRLLEVLITKDDQHDNLQLFLDRYSELLSEYEAFIFFHLPTVPEDDSLTGVSTLLLYSHMYSINEVFSPSFANCSAKNKQFSLSRIFSILLKFLQSRKKFQALSLFSTPRPKITTFLPLHHLFYSLLAMYSNPKEVLEEECKKNSVTLQEFCRLSIIYPTRILTAAFVPERFRLLNRATMHSITFYIDSPKNPFNYMFGLVQTLLAVAPDKDKLLADIVTTFGSNDPLPPLPSDIIGKDQKRLNQMILDFQTQIDMRDSAIVDASIFIMALLTDRSIITFDKVLFRRLKVIGLLMITKPNSKEIEDYADEKLTNPIFSDDLESFAERVSTKNGCFFKLKNEDEFTPFFPPIQRANRTKIIMKYTDNMIPTLDYAPLPHGLDLRECFRSPIFISLMFSCLQNRALPNIQVGLAMFVQMIKNGSQFAPDSFINDNSFIIISDSVLNLTDQLKGFLSQYPNINFLTVKIQATKYPPLSIIESVKLHKQLGYLALEKSSLPDFLRPKMADDDQIKKEKKSKANNIKQQLIKEFEDKRNQFSTGIGSTSQSEQSDENDGQLQPTAALSAKSNDSPDASNILCNICQIEESNDVIGFPCLALPSLFPSLINKKLHDSDTPIEDLEIVSSIKICNHSVHFNCCKGIIKENLSDLERNTRNKYNCVIDRGLRNSFLPYFPIKENDDENPFNYEITPNMINAIEYFMDKSFNIFSLYDPLIPIKSFGGAVSILEVRHRSRPECLDDATVPLLIRNFLLTIYYKYKGTELAFNNEEELPLNKLLYLLIKSDDPKSNYKNIVKEISSSILSDDDYLYEFLRRAAIIEDFGIKLFKHDPSNFIDWDELLSFEALIERYEIAKSEVKDIELPLFETIPLAPRFVGLYQPPYNIDIFDCSLTKFVDLLTGQVVVFTKSTQFVNKSKFPTMLDYVYKVYRGGLAVFLSITGPNASDVIACADSIKFITAIDGFYVDKFGDVDKGFKRGALLSLSKDRLEKILDKILSGDIIP